MRVLLVEDERSLSAAIVKMLRREHFEADAAYTGPEGLDDALSGGYDAIILDVMLPGMDGFAILEEIRKKQGEKPLGILTHCNAGTLATSKYGTATAPMYVAIENGWKPEAMHVYCDETRPLLQGARLTSYELSRAGIPTSVQCDDMASLLMQSGKIQVIFVG